MNKKGFAIWKIVSLLLILGVLFMLIGFSSNITSTAKSFLGFGDDILPVDYTLLNEEANTGFSLLVDSLNKCKASKDNSCGCDVDLSFFSSTHELRINSEEIRLVNTKEENDILMWKESIEGLNCYMDGLTKNEKGDLVMHFDDDAFLYFEGILLDDEDYLLDKYQLYKKGNVVCWLSDVVKENKIKSLKSCG